MTNGEAIEWLEGISEAGKKIDYTLNEDDIEVIDTVLRTLEIKDEYFKLIDFLLIDYDGCESVETLKELIDEARDYIHKALKNDDKSVITVNSKKKFNILGEVIE
jgi:hypothetical protein